MNDQIKDELSGKLFGRKFTESKENKVCVTCGGEVSNFRDMISKREHEISGMCQKCQDRTFGGQ